MSRHTPGPWTVHSGYEQSLEVFADDGTMTAVAFGDDACSESANAKLIAAAPDMLEALKYVIDVSERQAEREGGLALAMCVAALAKAEDDE